MALDRLSRDAFELGGLYDRNEMPEGSLMSESRIKDLRHFALFLPFSCIESRQSATYRYKTETLKVIDKTEKTGLYGGFANPCISLQNGASQGSGPGGRWFESTRPDHFVFNSLHIKPFRKSGR